MLRLRGDSAQKSTTRTHKHKHTGAHWTPLILNFTPSFAQKIIGPWASQTWLDIGGEWQIQNFFLSLSSIFYMRPYWLTPTHANELAVFFLIRPPPQSNHQSNQSSSSSIIIDEPWNALCPPSRPIFTRANHPLLQWMNNANWKLLRLSHRVSGAGRARIEWELLLASKGKMRHGSNQSLAIIRVERENEKEKERERETKKKKRVLSLLAFFCHCEWLIGLYVPACECVPLSICPSRPLGVQDPTTFTDKSQAIPATIQRIGAPQRRHPQGTRVTLKLYSFLLALPLLLCVGGRACLTKCHQIFSSSVRSKKKGRKRETDEEEEGNRISCNFLFFTISPLYFRSEGE